MPHKVLLQKVHPGEVSQMITGEELSWDSPGAAAQPRDDHIQPDGEVGSFGAPRGNRLGSDRQI